MAEHDFDVRYVERDLGVTANQFTQRDADGDRGVVVEGECPGCRGYTRSEFPWGMPGTGTKGLESGPDVVGTEVLYCECGYPHPDQPSTPSFMGCGASWRAER